MRKPEYLPAIALLAALLQPVPAGAEKVQVEALQPARVLNMQRGARLGVLPSPSEWQGGWHYRNDDLHSDIVTAMLANVTVGDRKYFDVLARSAVMKAIEAEQGQRAGGLVDSSTLPEYGKVLGVEYIISGNTRYIYNSTWRKEEWSNCLFYRKNEDGENRCAKRQEAELSCQRLIITAVHFPQVTEVKTGRIKYKSKIEKSRKANACSGKRFDPYSYKYGSRVTSSANPLELVEAALSDAVAEFIEDVAPHYKQIKIYIRNSAKFRSLGKKARKANAKRFKFARKQFSSDFEKACELFDDIGGEVGYRDVDLVFNLSICSELQGDYATARQYQNTIEEAYDSRLKRPPKWFREAKKRLDTAIEHKKKLAEQLQDSDTMAEGF